MTENPLDVPIPAELLDEQPLPSEAIDAVVHSGSTIDLILAEPPDDLIEPIATVARWRAGDDNDAEWAMRMRAAAGRELDAIRDQAAAWRERIDSWEQQQTRDPARRCDLFDFLLADYARRERLAGGRATIALPSGKVTTTKKDAAGYKITDPDAVVEWAKQEAPEEAIVTTSKPVHAEVVKLLRAVQTEDGWVAVDQSGAVVRGVEVIPPGSISSPKVTPS
jgi:hypothetical protein